MTLQEALDEFAASMKGELKSIETIGWYKKRLQSLLDYLGPDRVLETITIGDLNRWRGTLVDRTTRYEDHPNRSPKPGGLSRATLQSYSRACRAFYSWLEHMHFIEVNPARELTISKPSNEPRRGISQEDVDKILEAARHDPRDFALVSFLAYTGARVGGCVGLRLCDLNLEMRQATIHEKGRGGNNKWRIVFLTEEAVKAMRRWLAARPNVDCDRVFLSHRSTHAPGPMTTNAIYQTLERLAAKAGVTNRCNPHEWRHGFARRNLEKGMPLSTVSQLLGHSDIGVTANSYGSFVTEQLQAAYDRFVSR